MVWIGRVELYGKVQGTKYKVLRFTIERLTIYGFNTYARIDLKTYRRRDIKAFAAGFYSTKVA